MTKTGMRLIYIPVFHLDPEAFFTSISPSFPGRLHVEARVARSKWLGCIPFLRFSQAQGETWLYTRVEDSCCISLSPSIGGVVGSTLLRESNTSLPQPRAPAQTDSKRVIILITCPPCGSVRLHNPGNGAEMRGQYFAGD